MGHLMNVLFEKYMNEIVFPKIMKSLDLNEIILALKSVNKYINEFIIPYLK